MRKLIMWWIVALLLSAWGFWYAHNTDPATCYREERSCPPGYVRL